MSLDIADTADEGAATDRSGEGKGRGYRRLRPAAAEELVPGTQVYCYRSELVVDDAGEVARFPQVVGTVAGTQANQTLAFGFVDVVAGDGTQHSIRVGNVAVEHVELVDEFLEVSAPRLRPPAPSSVIGRYPRLDVWTVDIVGCGSFPTSDHSEAVAFATMMAEVPTRTLGDYPGEFIADTIYPQWAAHRNLTAAIGAAGPAEEVIGGCQVGRLTTGIGGYTTVSAGSTPYKLLISDHGIGSDTSQRIGRHAAELGADTPAAYVTGERDIWAPIEQAARWVETRAALRGLN